MYLRKAKVHRILKTTVLPVKDMGGMVDVGDVVRWLKKCRRGGFVINKSIPKGLITLKEAVSLIEETLGADDGTEPWLLAECREGEIPHLHLTERVLLFEPDSLMRSVLERR